MPAAAPVTPVRLARRPDRAATWPAVVTALVAAGALVALDGRVGETQQALLVVGAAAVAGAWLTVPVAVGVAVLAVLAFDLAFVPPRGSFGVDDPGQVALLVSMALVTAVVAALAARQRSLVDEARREAWRSDRLRGLGEVLRASEDPADGAPALEEALALSCGGEVTLVLADGPLPPRRDDAVLRWTGPADEEQRVGLWMCLRHAQALGPGTGRHEEVADWYVPMRGRGAAHGAALVRAPRPADPLPLARADAQALCDRMGLALERRFGWRAAAQAREAAAAQAASNTFLAAVSHDYRTPLAAILGAATSLQDQGERLSAAQRAELAGRIADEARELDRMTVNTLQLVRLDAPGLRLQADWESAEEIVGTVLRHARRRGAAHDDPPPDVRASVEPGLPLLHVDALLLTQALDNLVDNARRHAPGSPIEIAVRRDGEQVLLAVRDRGPGIEPASRERVFEVFQRGAARTPGARDAVPEIDTPAGMRRELPRRGSGVGLAVARAIARALGGDLVLRPRARGGCSFECRLPVRPMPDTAHDVANEASP